MKRLPGLTLVLLTSCFLASAQPVSFGIKGGVSLTDAFPSQDLPLELIQGFRHTFSDSKDYLVGATVELRLPLHLSVEADALYRPLHFASSINIIDSPPNTTTGSFTSWEFPLLAKYRFPTPFAKPFLDAGPSFRATGDESRFIGGSRHLSAAGFAVGAGVDVKALLIHVSPEIRYTRWAADTGTFPILGTPSSAQNQVEFLLGVTF